MNLHEALLVLRDTANDYATLLEESDEDRERVKEIDKALKVIQPFIDLLKV